MFELPDHPDIRRVMRTGSPAAIETLSWRCPVCGAELEPDETVYTAETHGRVRIVGCALCVEARTAEGVYA